MAFLPSRTRSASSYDSLVATPLRALATFGLGTTDIVDATIFVHPSVDIEPGTLLDELSAHMFAETAPAMTITCSASIYTSSLISIKLTAYKRSD